MFSACGAGGPELLGKEPAWRAVGSLLMPLAPYTLPEASTEETVEVGYFKVGGGKLVGGGPRPGISLPPPGEVSLEVPEDLAAGARLLIEMGFELKTHKRWSDDVAVFDVLVDDVLVASQEMPFGSETPQEGRLWSSVEVELDGADEVTLRTRLIGEDARVVDAVFATLEIREPFEFERTKASVEHPNIIMVVVDTLRADRLEPYGYGRPTSPHLNEVAAEGVVFERSSAPSPWTSPSTASLMSGMDPLRHGFLNYDSSFLSYEDVTMAEVCRAAGMRTAALVANPILSPGQNFDQGFGEYREEYLVLGLDLVEDARAWIKERGDERFFLYLHLFDPHKPYLPIDPYAESFAGQAPPGYQLSSSIELSKARIEGGPVDEEALALFIAYDSDKYDAEVASSDAAIGALFDVLDELSLRDHTVVGLTSDHGEAFGEHGRLGHSSGLYDVMLEVPLVFAGPGVPSGTRRTDRVEIKDTGKTLLELGNVAGAELMEGRDLFADGASERAEELIFSSTWLGLFPDMEAGVIEKVDRIFRVESSEWTLIWTPRDDGEEDDILELYAAGEGTETEADVASSHPEVALRLRDAIGDWMELTQRDRGTRLEGEGAYEFLRGLGYVGGD
jgi:arylsulfatase A-like enzyme